MKYISLDLETTCLTPSPENILMISMVVENTEDVKPLEELPHFTCFVDQEDFKGSAFALGMNGWILDIISNRVENKTGYPVYCLDSWVPDALEFIKKHFPNGRANLAGKNVAVFDYQFLPQAIQAKFRHRMIDPGSIFLDWNQDKIMGLGDVKKTLKLDSYVSHNAYEDALDVIRILRESY